MFSSKTLADRNNDLTPVVHVHSGCITDGERIGSGMVAADDVVAPRPEFQYGKLEANPILVTFRCMLEFSDVDKKWTAESELGFADAGGWEIDPYNMPEHVAHAHRVLTLWLAVYG